MGGTVAKAGMARSWLLDATDKTRDDEQSLGLRETRGMSLRMGCGPHGHRA